MCAVTLCSASSVMLLDIMFFTFALAETWKEGGGRVYSSMLRSGLFSLSEQEQTSPWSQILQACKQKARFCGKPKMVLCSSGKLLGCFFPAANCSLCINFQFKSLCRRNAAVVHQASFRVSAKLAPIANTRRGKLGGAQARGCSCSSAGWCRV